VSSILENPSPEAISPATAANKVAHGAFLSRVPGGRWHDEPGIAWFETGVALGLLNGVVRTELAPGDAPAAIDRVLAHFQARRLPFHWRLGPTSRPPGVGELLTARSIAHVEDEPGMAVDLHALREDPPLAADLQIVPVTTDAQLESWMRTWGCGAPEEVIALRLGAYRSLSLDEQSPLRLLLGLSSGEPVATAALFLGGGVASIEDVVAVPAARRRGIGAAITLAAARAAHEVGYRVGVLTASPMGIDIYRRLGFREHGTWSTYEWRPSLESQNA
jgi:GNAT superfamily N-acetyltransferase